MRSSAAPSVATTRGWRPQFTAVILADVDSQLLDPLTLDMPKSLLPLANRPLLQYQLDLLQSAGFTEAVVVVPRDAHDRVEIFKNNEYKGNVAVDLVVVDDKYATAQMLRAVKDKIKGDFLVLTGDLVLGRTHLRDMMDLHRIRRSHVTFLFKKVITQEQLAKSGGGAGGKRKGEGASAGAIASMAIADDEVQLDIIGLAEEQGPNARVVMKEVPQEGKTSMRPSKALMRKCDGCLDIYANLMDANVYLLAGWVIELIKHKDFTSLEEDVLSHIVKQQFKGPGVFSAALSQPVGKSEAQAMIASLSAGAAFGGTDDGVRCYAHIVDSTDTKGRPYYCSKITSLKSYLAMNRELVSLPRELAAWDPPEGVRPKEGCVVGEGCHLGEQVNLKASVIGAGCKIGTRVKIHQCVLMDNVTVQDNVTLQGTVVSPHAVVQESCSLTDAFVGSYVTVPPRTKQKGGELMRE